MTQDENILNTPHYISEENAWFFAILLVFMASISLPSILCAYIFKIKPPPGYMYWSGLAAIGSLFLHPTSIFLSVLGVRKRKWTFFLYSGICWIIPVMLMRYALSL